MKQLLSTVALLTGALLASEQVARAESAGQELDAWFDFLGSLNEYSALEPPGSRGSIGVGLGLGAHGETTTRTQLYNAQMRGETADQSSDDDGRTSGDVTYMLPQIWLVKGSPWPVDFGATIGADPNAKFTQAGGHAQWTAYEELGTPALSVRASFSKLYGVTATEIQSYGLEAVAGYGFLRYFTVYGQIGATRHTARLAIDSGSEIEHLLVAGDESQTEERTWVEPRRAVGLKVIAWPPFVAVTGETAWRTDGERSVAAKLSVGM